MSAGESPKADLHCHSNCSDGVLSPEEVVTAAHQAGVLLLALTDHDTMAGLETARRAAHARGLRLLPGVEISTSGQVAGERRSLHLLGYFPVDWPGDATTQASWEAWLRQAAQRRRERNAAIGERLRSRGIPFPEMARMAAPAASKGTVPQFGRPHIARWLVENRFARDVAEAFKRFLMPGTATYVPLEGPQVDAAIAAIHAAGGIASLAHPGRLKFAWEPWLGTLSDMGLDALETFHSSHTVEQGRAYVRIAAQHHLGWTGGSDFHGRPGEQLGSVELAAPRTAAWPFSRWVRDS
ncbi:MAG: PHP domain-containing protein [Terriglobales bacterium]